MNYFEESEERSCRFMNAQFMRKASFRVKLLSAYLILSSPEERYFIKLLAGFLGFFTWFHAFSMALFHIKLKFLDFILVAVRITLTLYELGRPPWCSLTKPNSSNPRSERLTDFLFGIYIHFIQLHRAICQPSKAMETDNKARGQHQQRRHEYG